jgi:hypothetical protein
MVIFDFEAPKRPFVWNSKGDHLNVFLERRAGWDPDLAKGRNLCPPADRFHAPGF